jgi:hypothetical protein
LLIVRVGEFDLRNTLHVAAVGIGALLISLFAAHHFGKLHGGNAAAPRS